MTKAGRIGGSRQHRFRHCLTGPYGHGVFPPTPPPNPLTGMIFVNAIPEHPQCRGWSRHPDNDNGASRRIATPAPPAPATLCHLCRRWRPPHNITLMGWIANLTGLPTSLPVDELGWSGDGLEAEAFAWLAVRSLLGLPLSLAGKQQASQNQCRGKAA